MAQYQVTHTCGHTSNQNLYGKGSEREYQLRRLGNQACTECYRAAQLKSAQSATATLPALTGSDKQIAWATTIRAKLLKDLADKHHVYTDEYTGDGTDNMFRVPADILADAMLVAQSQTSAGYWIDNRNGLSLDTVIKSDAGLRARMLAAITAAAEAKAAATAEHNALMDANPDLKSDTDQLMAECNDLIKARYEAAHPEVVAELDRRDAQKAAADKAERDERVKRFLEVD